MRATAAARTAIFFIIEDMRGSPLGVLVAGKGDVGVVGTVQVPAG
jgi:hypothetical protein